MLEALGRRRAPHDRLIGPDVVEILCHLAQALSRMVGVLVDRHGSVSHVVVSRRWQLLLDAAQHRAGRARGLRYVEAHPSPDGRPDDGDRQALTRLMLDAVVTAGTERGTPTDLWVLSHPTRRVHDRDAGPVIWGPHDLRDLAHLELRPLTRLAEDAARGEATVVTRAGERERAILVGLEGRVGGADSERSLDELAQLADTAGAQPLATVVQRRGRPHPARFLGQGKVEEVLRATEHHAADVVIVDGELTPVQQRTLEDELGVKVLDRTALVLDIFAQRARTREGRLQVELAQLSYLLPRLTGRGAALSRLGGGIGTRGPGETKLEVDRRRIRTRLVDLRREIDAIRQHRGRQRAPRKEAPVAQVALVGYTNAGKTTLLNTLTGADAFVEDRLFATLDPTARQLALPNGRTVVVVDTVGFIQRLPTEVVAAFRATLEEVVHADLLLHVVDASDPHWPAHVQVVRDVLGEIGAGERPALKVFNKVDRLMPDAIDALRHSEADAAVVAAATGYGIDDLRGAILRHLPDPWMRVRVHVPYTDAKLMARLHTEGRVLSTEYDASGTLVEAEVPGVLAVQLRSLALPAASQSPATRQAAPRAKRSARRKVG
jgi:GTP-binding protein HflX